MTNIITSFAIIYCIGAVLVVNATQCLVNLNKSKNFAFTKIIGGGSIRFVTQRPTIVLYEEETLELHCANKIELAHRYSKLPYFTNLKINCNLAGNIEYEKFDEWIEIHDSDSSIFICNSSLQELYASATALPDCDKNMSFHITSSIFTISHICYDFNKRSLKYASYEVYNTQDIEIKLNERVVPTLLSMDVKIGDINSILSFPDNDIIQKEIVNNELLKSVIFEYKSLIQDTPLKEDLASFEYLFNIVWWQNLRLGNWRFFLNALKKQSSTNNYMAYTGSSGVLTMPITPCQPLPTRIFNSLGTTAPEMVWTYLQPGRGSYEEGVVIIGINSPFYDFNNRTKLCEVDICDNIAWLKNTYFSKYHLNPALGVVYCCPPEEVQHKLDGFPRSIIATDLNVLSTDDITDITSSRILGEDDLNSIN